MALPKSVWVLLCGLSISCVSGLVGDDDIKGFSVLALEHSFGSGKDAGFTPRGTITIHSLKSGEAQYSDSDSLSVDEKQQLKDLVKKDDIYRIRVVPKNLPSGADLSAYSSSFIKACLLYESRLTFVININVDPSGNVLGLSIKPNVPFCTGQSISDNELNRYRTHVEVVQTTAGPQPETQAYIQKMEEEKAEKAKGQREDNRSFLGKYWYYLIPLVLFLMFATGDPNAAGGGGSGR